MGKKITFNEEQINLIIEMCNNGISDKDIGNKLGCSESRISKERKLRNILKPSDKLDELDVVKTYKETNLDFCKKKFHIGPNKLKEILKKYNIPLKTSRELAKYKYDENYFELIDTEEKAYWLGFICADGFLSSTRKHVIIELNKNDFHHLEKFRDCVSGNQQIHFYKQKLGETVRIEFSGNMYYSLTKMGLTSNKSYDLILPTKYIPDNLIRHFIRGFFDGDGSIHFDSYKDRYRISFTGLENVLNELKSILKIDVKLSMDKRTKSTYYLVINKEENIKRVLCYMYEDSNIYLDRKYKLYEKAV